MAIACRQAATNQSTIADDVAGVSQMDERRTFNAYVSAEEQTVIGDVCVTACSEESITTDERPLFRLARRCHTQRAALPLHGVEVRRPARFLQKALPALTYESVIAASRWRWLRR
jgi:hypothetical protein